MGEPTHIQQVTADLEELQSRGFAHPQADQIVGRMRVTLQQIGDAEGAPPPPADPVADRLDKLADQLDRLEFALLAAIEGARK